MVLAAVLLAIAAITSGLLAFAGPMVGDELVHFAQIQRFLSADFTVDRDHLTTIPGFHLLVAGVLRAFNAESLGAARLVNVGFGILAVFAFHRFRATSTGATDGIATLQFAALPILFPFFFLAYTDVLSLALVIGAVTATMSRRHIVAAALILLAMLVRQNNVVWLGLLLPLALLPVPPRFQDGKVGLRRLVREGWPYVACAAAFCVFWLWNGSISLSTAQASAHPDLRIGLGNIVFTLLLAGILLPFHAVQGLQRLTAKCRSAPWMALLPLLLFGIFLIGFEVDHPYNLIDPRWSWRNHILQASNAHLPIKVVICLVAALAACGLASLGLMPPKAVWIYPISLVLLASSWLIDTRYALIPVALWLAFRVPIDRRAEWATFILWLAAGTWLFHGVMHGMPFL